MSNLLRHAALSLIIIAVALSACSSTPSDLSTQSNQGEMGGGPLAPYEPSPIDLAFGFNEVPTEKELLALYEKRQEFETTCVRSDGFDWHLAPLQKVKTQTPRSRLQLLEQHGYGTVKSLRQQFEMDETLAEIKEQEAELQAHLNNLSLAERERWSDTSLRCSNEALQRFPEPQASSPPVELMEEISRERQLLRSNSGFDAITQLWASCMRETGFEVSNRSDTRNLLADKIEEFQNLQRSFADKSDLERVLVALESKEEEIINADIKCSISTGSEAKAQELRFQLEKELLEKHGARWGVELVSSD